MAELFVIRNQLGHYWGKSKTWVDGSEARAVKHTAHRDDAVNTLFELSSKDFELRGEVLQVAACGRSRKRNPGRFQRLRAGDGHPGLTALALKSRRPPP